MPISKETVLHTSRLARLDLAAGTRGAEAEARIDHVAARMGLIVEYIDILNQADTTGVEPLFSPMSRTASPGLDVPNDAPERAILTREDALRNAPEQERGMFAVPRIL